MIRWGSPDSALAHDSTAERNSVRQENWGVSLSRSSADCHSLLAPPTHVEHVLTALPGELLVLYCGVARRGTGPLPYAIIRNDRAEHYARALGARSHEGSSLTKSRTHVSHTSSRPHECHHESPVKVVRSLRIAVLEPHAIGASALLRQHSGTRLTCGSRGGSRRESLRPLERQTIAKSSARLVHSSSPVYFVAYLDRVNVSFAALTMNKDLGLSGVGLRVRRRHLLPRLFPVRGAVEPVPGARRRAQVDRADHVHLGPDLRRHGVRRRARPASTSCGCCSGLRRPASSPASSFT